MSSTSSWEVAQPDIGRLKAPTDDPLVAGSMAQLEPINAIPDDAATADDDWRCPV